MTFSIPFYIYFLTWKRLLLSLSLSLSHVVFLCEFFIFYISTLDWCIYVFFRILLWVAIWFCVFKLLSFFFLFSIIVKCYYIAYKYSLQEYNIIILYVMVWIIWCLTYDYIFYLILFFSHFIFYFSPEKVITLSLSLSLSIYIYIYSLLQLYFRLMNNCIILYNTILG